MGIYLPCTCGFTLHTWMQSPAVLSEWSQFITSFAYSGLWPFSPTDVTACTRNLCRTEIIWTQVIWENISISSHGHVTLRRELFSLLRDKDNANAVKTSAQPQRVLWFCTANPVRQAQLPYWYPMVNLWNTLLLHWRYRAVCSHHCLLHTLFVLQRLSHLRPVWWDTHFLIQV